MPYTRAVDVMMQGQLLPKSGELGKLRESKVEA